MKNYVITIARENGSNGPRHRRGVGRGAWASLFTIGISCAWPPMTAASTNNCLPTRRKAFRSSLLFRVAKDAYNGEVIPPDSDNFVSNENLVPLPGQGDAGPGAERELCDDRPLRGLYFARPAQCAACVHPRAGGSAACARVMQRHNLSEAEARRHMRQVDKRRADYYRAFTGSDWRDAGHYDICFDSDHMGEEKIIRFIMGYMNVCFED